jgi:hypothetical protein
MKVNKSLVASDLDGVVFDFYAGVKQFLEKLLDRELKIVSEKSYSIAPRYGLNDKEKELYNKNFFSSKLWTNIPALPGAVEAINELIDMGNEIVYVTGVPESLMQYRIENLYKLGLNKIKTMECVGFGNACKNAALLKHMPFAYIDDRLDLLHNATFVPDRVWVDQGHEQNGFVVDENIIYVNSLKQWVNQHKNSIDFKPRRKSLKFVK